MSEVERELYGLLIEGIASRLFALQESTAAAFERDGVELFVNAPYFYHHHLGTFERCSDLLWRLGILRSITDDNKWDCAFRFAVLPEHCASAAGLREADKPSFLEVLTAYIDLRSEHGRLPIRAAEAFEVQQSEEAIYFRLAAAGYVECVAQGYRWTSKAQIALEAAWLCEWDDSLQH